MSTVNWQPIETAPKDGTRILLWDERHKQAIETYWMKPLSCHHSNKPDWEANLENRSAFDCLNFTHWAPKIKGPT